MKKLFLPSFICVTSTTYGVEEVIVGFGLSEMEKKTGGALGGKRGVDKCLITNRSSSGFDFAAPYEMPTMTSVAWVWRIRRGDATEGQFALSTRQEGIQFMKMQTVIPMTGFSVVDSFRI